MPYPQGTKNSLTSIYPLGITLKCRRPLGHRFYNHNISQKLHSASTGRQPLLFTFSAIVRCSSRASKSPFAL